jgi:glycosyltransferase involved in cell wall biosynthesis
MNASFSIITCTKNSAAWLDACIASVLMQDADAVELVFVDGGSTDGTLEKIRALERPYLLLENVGGGISAAMNAGLRAASGDIVAHLHSDDYYLAPDVLSTVARALDGSGYRWLYGRIVQDLGGRQVAENFRAPDYSYEALLQRNFIPHPATFVQRRLLIAAGGFDTTLRYAMDYDLWLRLARLAPPLPLARALAAFRVHADSLSSSNRLPALEEDFLVRLRYAGSGLAARTLHALRYLVRRQRLQRAERKAGPAGLTSLHSPGRSP